MPVVIRLVRESDRPEWLRLRRLLWPECPDGLHATEMDDYLRGSAVAVFVAEREGGELAGFVKAALRPEAIGCGAGPVGYVEGWYVDADLRRQGVGRLLVQAAEDWARRRNCREMASDAEVENAVSRRAHAALGYHEVIRLAHFRKPLCGQTVAGQPGQGLGAGKPMPPTGPLPRTFAPGRLPGTFAVSPSAPEAARAGGALVLLLRVLGCVDVLALAAVLMPRTWMARGHAWAGLGEMPPGPFVGYLCRSASLLYALHGATVLFVSSDLPRYGRLVTFLAGAALVHGVLMLGIDLAEGMPPWWTAVEGPAFAVTGAAVLVLQRWAGR